MVKRERHRIPVAFTATCSLCSRLQFFPRSVGHCGWRSLERSRAGVSKKGAFSCSADIEGYRIQSSNHKISPREHDSPASRAVSFEQKSSSVLSDIPLPENILWNNENVEERGTDAGMAVRAEEKSEVEPIASHVLVDEDWEFFADTSQELFFVDGFGLLYRSYYALAKTTMSARGMFDTRAVYGFTTVLLSLLQKHVKGNPAVVVFEGRKKKGETDFRTALYPEYKEGRSPTPAGVLAAIPWVKRIVRALGLVSLEEHLFEADDVIGTLVRKAKTAGIPSVIVSIDKDFRQLLDGNLVRILRPGRGSGPFEYVTEDSFREEYSNVHPSRYVDILTLVGDKADSIKGVPGIGPRTAPKLIKHYGSLEALLDAARDYMSADTNGDNNHSSEKVRTQKKTKSKAASPKLLTEKLAESLRQHEERTVLLKTIVAIRDTVPIPKMNQEDLWRGQVDESDVQEISRLLEFTSSLVVKRMLHSADDVPPHRVRVDKSSSLVDLQEQESSGVRTMMHTSARQSSKNIEVHPSDYRTIVQDTEIKEFLGSVDVTMGISTFVKTSNEGVQALQGVALCSGSGSAIYVDCTIRKQFPQTLVEILTNPAIEKRGWFMKETSKALLSHTGIPIRGKLFDVRIAADLVHSGQRLTDASLASEYLWENALQEWISGEKMKRLTPPESPQHALVLSDLGYQMAFKLDKVLEENDLKKVADQVEFPLIPVLAEMELAGVPFRSSELKAFEDHVRNRLEDVEKSLRAVVSDYDPDGSFRPSSRDHVARLLFDTWGLRMRVKPTSTGKYPANKKVLSLVVSDRSIPGHIRQFAELMLEHREVSKILNTYTRSLLNAVHKDGRIRTTFIQDASPSGRLSTSHPNLQSIPSRSQLGRKVRSTVLAADGFSILCADYSQIELRILASLSGDPSLQAAFANGIDVHTAVAGKIFGIKNLKRVTKEQRTKAKEVSYGIPYGISVPGLAQQLNIPNRDAKQLISGFHKQFPVVQEFTLGLVEAARREGHAKTLFGRKLPLPLLLHGGPQERRAAERVAINMPIQGTQADMIKLAMIRIASRLRDARASSKMILQVHDELVLEVADEEKEAVENLVREEMANALPLSNVDIVVDIGFGESWLSAANG